MAQTFLGTTPTRVDWAPASPPFSDVPITASIWARPTNTSDQVVFAIADKDAANYHSFRQSFSGQTGRISCVSFAGGSNGSTSIAQYTQNQWNHYAGVWASNTSRTMFLDGVAATTNTASVSVPNLDRVTIGISADSTPFGGHSGGVAECAV